MLGLDGVALGIVATIISTVATLTWWLSGQFSTIRTLVFDRIKVSEKIIIDKLEYHERHDDERFNRIREDIGEIRLRNAAKDTVLASVLAKIDKLNGK